MSRAAQDVPAPGGLWRRWWFHLGALMIIVPAVFLKPYLDLQAMLRGGAEADLRGTAIAAGPWTFDLQERGEEEPYWDPHEGNVKPFRIVPCTPCVKEIRAIFINLKRPGSSEYGAEFEGNPYRAFGDMKLRHNALPADTVWITAEGWDGSLYQTTIPLAQASPITARWLEDRAARKSNAEPGLGG